MPAPPAIQQKAAGRALGKLFFPKGDACGGAPAGGGAPSRCGRRSSAAVVSMRVNGPSPRAAPAGREGGRSSLDAEPSGRGGAASSPGRASAAAKRRGVDHFPPSRHTQWPVHFESTRGVALASRQCVRESTGKMPVPPGNSIWTDHQPRSRTQKRVGTQTDYAGSSYSSQSDRKSTRLNSSHT